MSLSTIPKIGQTNLFRIGLQRGLMVLSIHHARYVAVRQCLKALRKGAKLSQIELAARLGEDQSYVSKIERGDRYVDVLFFVDWCNACGVQPEEGLKTLLQKC